MEPRVVPSGYVPIVLTGFQYPHEELSLEDKITICIMESYLDFKVSPLSDSGCSFQDI